jgi:hypothetical protein
MNDEIIGAAARIQVYVARLGFGITLARNQMVDAMPLNINKDLTGKNFLKKY